MTIYLGIRISVTISRIVSGLNIGTVSVTTLSHTKMFKLDEIVMFYIPNDHHYNIENIKKKISFMIFIIEL